MELARAAEGERAEAIVAPPDREATDPSQARGGRSYTLTGAAAAAESRGCSARRPISIADRSGLERGLAMDRIRCGVIGLGWFGEHHVDTLKQLPQAELTSICTRRPERLQEVARKYGVPRTHTDYRELLADPEVDLVSIVTHVDDHLEPALAALQAGKHVFLEKPMAGSVEACDRIIEAARATSQAFMVGHICRFDTVYALAKEEIAAGRLGKLVSLHARRNLASWISESHLPKISALFGDGVHDLALMLWYTVARPRSVYAQTSN